MTKKTGEVIKEDRIDSKELTLSNMKALTFNFNKL